MKVLLLGKDGQVGTELKRSLLPLGNLYSIGRHELNLINLPSLSQLLNTYQPNIIVNAAAYTAVDKAEDDAKTAFIINQDVVTLLAQYAKCHHALLVHYSTDYVFDGQKQGAYIETDAVNPQSVYGASKSAGEKAIALSGCDYLLLRTSWVFSATGKNFVKTVLQLAKEKDRLSVVSDQYGIPTSATWIADMTHLMIEAHQKQQIPNGIVHLTPIGVTTWYQFACYIIDKVHASGMALKLHSNDISPISTQEYPLPAKRPSNSRLDNSLLCHALRAPIADWSAYVDPVIEQLIQRELVV